MKGKKILWAAALFAFLLPKDGAVSMSAPHFRVGMASWYSESDPGINLTTANGEIFDDSRFTCATWEFPFHTRLRVTNLANQRSVVCRVNDRGPSKRLNRLIDLTRATFQEIAPLRFGLIKVKVERESHKG